MQKVTLNTNMSSELSMPDEKYYIFTILLQIYY